MSKYIKLEDAQTAFRKKYDMFDDWYKINRVLNSLQTFEVADLSDKEVVRCEKCIWRDKDNQDEDYCAYVKGLADINGESFCSWGERIE